MRRSIAPGSDFGAAGIPVLRADSGAYRGAVTQTRSSLATPSPADSAGAASDPRGGRGGPPPEAEVFHAEGRRAAERLLARAALGNGAEVRVARVFNAYGPGMTPGCGRVVPTFVVQALRGQPLTIHGNGQQRRAFCFVDDAVRGLLALMAAAEAPAGPVDLGGERVLTISQLAALVIDRTGAGGDVEYTPAVNPRDLVPDLGLARAR